MVLFSYAQRYSADNRAAATLVTPLKLRISLRLLRNHDWRPPEIRLCGRRIEYRHLTLVLPGLQSRRTDIEAKRRHAEPCSRVRVDSDRPGLERLDAIRIQSHKRHERVARRRRCSTCRCA